MAIERIHSSDTQLFINDQRVPAVVSLSLSSSKKLTDIQRLGSLNVTNRILNSDQSTKIDIGINLTTGATGIDPFYSFQQMQSGFLSTGEFDF